MASSVTSLELESEQWFCEFIFLREMLVLYTRWYCFLGANQLEKRVKISVYKYIYPPLLWQWVHICAFITQLKNLRKKNKPIKIWGETFSKIYRSLKSIWKKCSASLITKKYKFKQWDIISHPWERNTWKRNKSK